MPVLKVRVDNCWVDISGTNNDIELAGYASEEWVQENYQPKGEPTDEYINNLIDARLSQINSAEGVSF